MIITKINRKQFVKLYQRAMLTLAMASVTCIRRYVLGLRLNRLAQCRWHPIQEQRPTRNSSDGPAFRLIFYRMCSHRRRHQVDLPIRRHRKWAKSMAWRTKSFRRGRIPHWLIAAMPSARFFWFWINWPTTSKWIRQFDSPLATICIGLFDPTKCSGNTRVRTGKNTEVMKLICVRSSIWKWHAAEFNSPVPDWWSIRRSRPAKWEACMRIIVEQIEVFRQMWVVAFSHFSRRIQHRFDSQLNCKPHSIFRLTHSSVSMLDCAKVSRRWRLQSLAHSALSASYALAIRPTQLDRRTRRHQ